MFILYVRPRGRTWPRRTPMSAKAILTTGSALMISLLACARADAGGVILYDNLSSPVTGGDPAALSPVGLGQLFASFSNPLGARTLTELELNLSATNPSDGDTFTVSVWSDKNTAPNSLLWHTTVNDLICQRPPQSKTFPLTSVSMPIPGIGLESRPSTDRRSSRRRRSSRASASQMSSISTPTGRCRITRTGLTSCASLLRLNQRPGR